MSSASVSLFYPLELRARSLHPVNVLVEVHFLLPGHLKFLFELLLEFLDVPAAFLALHSQILQLVVVMASPDVIAHISEHSRVFFQILRVFEVFKLIGCLDAILCTQLLVLVLLIRLLTITISNAYTQIKAFLDQIHVVAHDQNMVSFVNLSFDLKSLLQRVHGVLQELALVFVLLLDVGVYVSILRLLILDEVEETLIDRDL